MKRFQAPKESQKASDSNPKPKKIGDTNAKQLYIIANTMFMEYPEVPYSPTVFASNPSQPLKLCECPSGTIKYTVFEETNPWPVSDTSTVDPNIDIEYKIQSTYLNNNQYKKEDLCICEKKNTYYDSYDKLCKCISGTTEDPETGECACPENQIYRYTLRTVTQQPYVDPARVGYCYCPSPSDIENTETESCECPSSVYQKEPVIHKTLEDINDFKNRQTNNPNNTYGSQYIDLYGNAVVYECVRPTPTPTPTQTSALSPSQTPTPTTGLAPSSTPTPTPTKKCSTTGACYYKTIGFAGWDCETLTEEECYAKYVVSGSTEYIPCFDCDKACVPKAEGRNEYVLTLGCKQQQVTPTPTKTPTQTPTISGSPGGQTQTPTPTPTISPSKNGEQPSQTPTPTSTPTPSNSPPVGSDGSGPTEQCNCSKLDSIENNYDPAYVMPDTEACKQECCCDYKGGILKNVVAACAGVICGGSTSSSSDEGDGSDGSSGTPVDPNCTTSKLADYAREDNHQAILNCCCRDGQMIPERALDCAGFLAGEGISCGPPEPPPEGDGN